MKKDFSVGDEEMRSQERWPWGINTDRFGEMMGVSIPRKARSTHAKRASTFLSTPPSDALIRKRKKKQPKGKPRTSKSSKSPASIKEIEIEVAEVLFGLTRHFEAPLGQASNNIVNDDSYRPVNFEDKKIEDQSECKAAEVENRVAEVQVPKKSYSRKRTKKSGEKKDLISDGFISKSPESGIKCALEANRTEEKLNPDSTPAQRRASMGSFSQGKIMGACNTPCGSSESKKVVEEHDSQASVRDNSSDVAELDTLKENEDEKISKPESRSEKTSASLSLPTAGARCPGGPPFGYIGQIPLQSSGPVEGPSSSTVPAQKPRMKRCATHCYIAHKILLHQHVAQMGPFWPMAAANAYNLNQNSLMEAAQKQQQLLQHPNPAGSAKSMMGGPQYFLFQNNYRIPVPSFRPGNHSQQMAFLNPAFFSSRMLHHQKKVPEANQHSNGDHGLNGPSDNEKGPDGDKSGKVAGLINGEAASSHRQINNFASHLEKNPFGFWTNLPRSGVHPVSSPAQSSTANPLSGPNFPLKNLAVGVEQQHGAIQMLNPYSALKSVTNGSKANGLNNLPPPHLLHMAHFPYLGMPSAAMRPDQKPIAGIWDKSVLPKLA